MPETAELRDPAANGLAQGGVLVHDDAGRWRPVPGRVATLRESGGMATTIAGAIGEEGSSDVR